MSGSVRGTKPAAGQSDSENGDLIETAAAAEILGCSTRYVRRIGEDRLGGFRVAGRWVFNERVVRLYAAGRK